MTPVTNRQFRAFVQATGHVTIAETKPDPKDYPGALPHMLKAGSLVFSPPNHQVNLQDWSQWWAFTFGANWRRPYGPGSSIKGLDEHPVVHVAYPDAEAYARWAGKSLPTEAGRATHRDPGRPGAASIGLILGAARPGRVKVRWQKQSIAPISRLPHSGAKRGMFPCQ